MRGLTTARTTLLAGFIAAVVAASLLFAPSASATYPGANGKIGFISPIADIFAVNFDGTGLTNLTPGPGTNRVFRWSPDGTEVAFISDGDGLDNSYDLYMINADGSGLVKLSSTEAAGGFDWAPDGSKLVFADGGGQGRQPGTLWTVNADGSGQTQIGFRNDPSERFYSAPAWSPDGTKIAVVKSDGTNDEIFTINPDGTNETRLTDNPSLDFRPAWSPDSQRIAFTTNREASCCFTIYVMNADGSDQRRLTDDSAINSTPEWSPDGLRIAFLSLRDHPFAREIYTVNVDGSDVRRVTVSPDDDSLHTWAPDSSKIAFMRRVQGTQKVYVINSDGTGERFLADGIEPDWQPLVPSSFRNASEFCKAQRAASGRAAFRQRYRTFGHCIRQNRDL